MGKLSLLWPAVIVSLNFISVTAQSRPPAEPIVKKTNQRPASAPTPLPTVKSQNTEENTTNIDAIAQIPEPAKDDDILEVDTNLVTIPVKVSDRNGRLVSGLQKVDFRVFENDAEQDIAYFSNEEQPFIVALVLDMSYSTTFKINEIQTAANAFVAELRPNDRVMVVAFDEEVHVLCEPTNNRDVLLRAIRNTKIATGTSLYEAVDLVINQKLKKYAGRKAIVLFTDGVDTTSRKANDSSNRSDASELDALIYPVQYDTYADVQRMKNKSAISKPTIPSPIPTSSPTGLPFPIPISGIGTPSSQGTTVEEYQKAGEYLSDMANRTGGRVFQATTIANLGVAFSNIASELRQFYSLGYYPQIEGREGERRKIKVKVNQPKVAVQSRDGYIVGKKR